MFPRLIYGIFWQVLSIFDSSNYHQSFRSTPLWSPGGATLVAKNLKKNLKRLLLQNDQTFCTRDLGVMWEAPLAEVAGNNSDYLLHTSLCAFLSCCSLTAERRFAVLLGFYCTQNRNIWLHGSLIPHQHLPELCTCSPLAVPLPRTCPFDRLRNWKSLSFEMGSVIG